MLFFGCYLFIDWWIIIQNVFWRFELANSLIFLWKTKLAVEYCFKQVRLHTVPFLSLTMDTWLKTRSMSALETGRQSIFKTPLESGLNGNSQPLLNVWTFIQKSNDVVHSLLKMRLLALSANPKFWAPWACQNALIWRFLAPSGNTDSQQTNLPYQPTNQPETSHHRMWTSADA